MLTESELKSLEQSEPVLPMNQIQKPSIQLDCEQIKAVLEYQRSVRLHNDNERLKAAFKRGELEANPGETLYLPGAIEVAVVRPVCKKIYICKEKLTGDEILCPSSFLYKESEESFTAYQLNAQNKAKRRELRLGSFCAITSVALLGIVCLLVGHLGTAIMIWFSDIVCSPIFLLARPSTKLPESTKRHCDCNAEAIETLGLSRYLGSGAQPSLYALPSSIMKKNYLADAKVGE